MIAVVAAVAIDCCSVVGVLVDCAVVSFDKLENFVPISLLAAYCDPFEKRCSTADRTPDAEVCLGKICSENCTVAVERPAAAEKHHQNSSSDYDRSNGSRCYVVFFDDFVLVSMVRFCGSEADVAAVSIFV